MDIIAIIWIIGAIASILISFLWKNDFRDSKEFIRQYIRIVIMSVGLSWIYFFAQLAIILWLYHLFNKEHRYEE